MPRCHICDTEYNFQNGPNSSNFYSSEHSFVAPICHICGVQGHIPTDFQQGGSSYTPNCFGMNFAQQHSPYHNNYSPGWPENPNMTYRDSGHVISSFSPSYPMQGFRNEEDSNYKPHYQQIQVQRFLENVRMFNHLIAQFFTIQGLLLL